MRSLQMMGDAWPRPGIGVCQRMFSPDSMFQVTGAASSDTPEACGPRNCVQFSVEEARTLANSTRCRQQPAKPARLTAGPMSNFDRELRLVIDRAGGDRYHVLPLTSCVWPASESKLAVGPLPVSSGHENQRGGSPSRRTVRACPWPRGERAALQGSPVT